MCLTSVLWFNTDDTCGCDNTERILYNKNTAVIETFSLTSVSATKAVITRSVVLWPCVHTTSPVQTVPSASTRRGSAIVSGE